MAVRLDSPPDGVQEWQKGWNVQARGPKQHSRQISTWQPSIWVALGRRVLERRSA